MAAESGRKAECRKCLFCCPFLPPSLSCHFAQAAGAGAAAQRGRWGGGGVVVEVASNPERLPHVRALPQREGGSSRARHAGRFVLYFCFAESDPQDLAEKAVRRPPGVALHGRSLAGGAGRGATP